MVGAVARMTAAWKRKVSVMAARPRATVLFTLMLVLALMLTACSSGGAREVDGNIDAHDPALAKDGDTWFVYSTGVGTVKDGNIQVRSSSDGKTWRQAGFVWDTKPAWIKDAVPGVDNLWAPELYEHDGTWYLYYSASTFGKNTSVIALATNSTLDPDSPDYAWEDQGLVVESTASDNFNAIDPAIAVDDDGTPWMAFGSFWSGIQMVQLTWPTGLRADDSVPIHLADRGVPPNAIEAPYLVEHDGSWFMFVSEDSCCQGVKSTYKIVVGRADALEGPYVDKDGTPLLNGGGTVLLESEGARIGPGGQSVYDGVMALHYYDAKLNGQYQLGLIDISWDGDGWPVLAW